MTVGVQVSEHLSIFFLFKFGFDKPFIFYSLPGTFYIMYERAVIPATQALYHGHFLWSPLVAFGHKFLVEDVP
jgi:hypothetical protein